MKLFKIFFWTSLLFTTCININLIAQDYQSCKLEVDKKDDFTGDHIRTSKQLLYKKSENKQIGMYIKRVNNNYKIEIVCVVSTAVQWISGKDYRCQEGNRMLLKLRNGEIVALPVKSWNSRWEQPNFAKRAVLGAWAVLSKDYKYFFEQVYEPTEDDIIKLSQSEIDKVRIELIGYDIDTKKPFENIEFNVQNEYSNKVMKDAKCIVIKDGTE